MKKQKQKDKKYKSKENTNFFSHVCAKIKKWLKVSGNI